MSVPDNWIKQFGISQSDQAAFQAAAQAENSDPLRWCLMNGKIPEPEYITWAMSRYDLPSVSGDFFTAPNDPEFWERVKNLHSWHSGFFPLADWEGVLYIACLEPPQEFQFSQSHLFVLASARHLLLLWNRLNPATVDPAVADKHTVSSSGAISLGPIHSELNVEKKVASSEAGDFSIVTNFDGDGGAPPPDMPEGMILNAKPSGFSMAGLASVAVKSVAPPTVAAVMADAPPPKEMTAITISNLGSQEITSARNMNELGALCLIHIMKHFEGGMVLTFETGILKPWKWSDYLTTPKNQECKQINISGASIFKIVQQTKLPFHGTVSASEVNNAFFDAFSATGKPPTSVSVVPILHEKEPIGMVLGVGAKVISYKKVLPPAERLAYDISLTLIRLRASQAA